MTSRQSARISLRGDPTTGGRKQDPGALEGVIVGTVTNAAGNLVAGQKVQLARTASLTTSNMPALVSFTVKEPNYLPFESDLHAGAGLRRLHLPS